MKIFNSLDNHLDLSVRFYYEVHPSKGTSWVVGWSLDPLSSEQMGTVEAKVA